jgi:hypothetical protein
VTHCHEVGRAGQNGRVNGAELSSLSTAVEELAQRLSAHIQDAGGDRRESITAELLEVERALNTAVRRLRRLLETST